MTQVHKKTGQITQFRNAHLALMQYIAARGARQHFNCCGPNDRGTWRLSSNAMETHLLLSNGMRYNAVAKESVNKSWLYSFAVYIYIRKSPWDHTRFPFRNPDSQELSA